jgi:hypothetical protein
LPVITFIYVAERELLLNCGVQKFRRTFGGRKGLYATAVRKRFLLFFATEPGLISKCLTQMVRAMMELTSTEGKVIPKCLRIAYTTMMRAMMEWTSTEGEAISKCLAQTAQPQ